MSTYTPSPQDLAKFEAWADRLVSFGEAMTEADMDSAQINLMKNVGWWLITQVKHRGKWPKEAV